MVAIEQPGTRVVRGGSDGVGQDARMMAAYREQKLGPIGLQRVPVDWVPRYLQLLGVTAEAPSAAALARLTRRHRERLLAPRLSFGSDF